MKKKILAICSGGGHWIQMERILPAFKEHEIAICTVDKKVSKKYPYTFYSITDSNLTSKFLIIKTFFDSIRIVNDFKPDVIVSTGAAPGFFGVFWGRITGRKTIWIDSIANAERLSLSGRVAVYFASIVLTQWPNVAKGKVQYQGAVL